MKNHRKSRESSGPVDFRKSNSNMRYANAIKNLFAAFPLLLLFIQGAAQTKTLTLQQSIELGIQNSKQLKLNKAKIDEAIANSREAEDRRLPEASISGSYLRFNKPDVKLKTPAADSAGGASATFNQALYGMVSVSQPLFAGMKIKYGIESARYLEQATRLDAANDKEEIVLNTIASYINLYKAKAAARLVQENLIQSRKRDADFSNLEKNGLLARNDLLKSQLETSNFELALVDAQNSIQLAMVNMNLLLGLPEATILQLDSSTITGPAEIKTVIEYEAIADQNRKDVQALAYRQKAADAAIKVARGDYYPNIALTGGLVAANIPDFLTVSNAVNIGLGLKYDIASLWKTKSKIQQAEARKQQIIVSEEMLNDQIRFSINKAYNDYLTGLKRIEVYTKAVDQASENYRISKNKYDNNLLLLTDLLDADVAQLRTRLNLEIAKADAVLAYFTLQQTAGILTQQ